jgi:hypothetical protein
MTRYFTIRLLFGWFQLLFYVSALFRWVSGAVLSTKLFVIGVHDVYVLHIQGFFNTHFSTPEVREDVLFHLNPLSLIPVFLVAVA